MRKIITVPLTALVLLLTPVGSVPTVAAAHSYYVEVPAGTRFLVELRTKLDAKKVKPGKKFSARTLEAVHTTDGSFLPPGATLKGRVAHAEKRGLLLRFESIKAGRKSVPIIATVVGVLGEKRVKSKTDREGEIEAKGGRGENAAIGAAIGAGAGAAVGAATAGGAKGTAIGAGIGAGAGALIGASSGGSSLVLHKGTRLELELDRPLAFLPK
jgi:hypothetical protein